jgi:hypothetical protein
MTGDAIAATSVRSRIDSHRDVRATAPPKTTVFGAGRSGNKYHPKTQTSKTVEGAGDLSMLMISTVSLVSFNRVGGGLNFTPWNVQ